MKTVYYSSQDNRFLTRWGWLSSEEVDELDAVEAHHQESLHRLSFHNLVDIFPEAKPVIKKALTARIKQYKQDLSIADKVRIEYNNKILSRIPWEHKWFFEYVRDYVYVNPIKEGKEKAIKRYYFYLSQLKPQVGDLLQTGISDTNISRAKSVLLETLYTGRLKKTGSTLVGPCPFHNEKNGSFTIYTKQNRWYCYGENIGGDVIDYAMKLYKCTFIEAVKKLTL